MGMKSGKGKEVLRGALEMNLQQEDLSTVTAAGLRVSDKE